MTEYPSPDTLVPADVILTSVNRSGFLFVGNSRICYGASPGWVLENVMKMRRRAGLKPETFFLLFFSFFSPLHM